VNLLQLVQSACDRLSLSRPSAVLASSDRQVRQLAAIATEVGEDLSARGDPGWQSLTAEWTFITVADEVQSGTPVPPDLRNFIPGSFFNRTQQRQLTGPLTARQYQLIKARPAASSIFLSYRERGDSFLISPTPSAGDTIAYEYISKYWVKSNANVPKAAFTADEDMTYLDDELMILGLKWRYRAAKGLDYGEDMVSFERAVEAALGADGGKGDLNIGGDRVFPEALANIPDGSWPTS